MPFMHPLLFWGGAAAVSTPVIIHLLNRRRFRVLDWAAMKFLLESVRRNRRRIRLEELILLVLRCLAIFLLAVAVGRFLGCAGSGVPLVGHRAAMAHVFILDDSVSMGQKIGDTTAFRKAVGDLEEMVERIKKEHSSDRVAILLTSRVGEAESFARLKTSAELVSPGGWLKSLRPSDTAARLGRALTACQEILKTEETGRRVYLLSDFRRADYSDERLAGIRRELKALQDGGAELRLMSYGRAAENLTIETVEVLNKLPILHVPVTVRVCVRNNGSEEAENVTVRFTGRGVDTAAAELPVCTISSIDPGEEKVVQVDYMFRDVGPGVIEANLLADNLPGDNVARVALDVREARKVLIVDGEPDVSDATNSEAFNLVGALDPNADHGYGTAVDVVSAERLDDASFAKYDAVILANVRDFPMTPVPAEAAPDRPPTTMPDMRMGYGQLKPLEDYVRAGGGLAIFTGDRVHPTFYNGPLYRNGLGLLPLKVKPPVGDARSRIKYVRLLRDSIANRPVMRSFWGSMSRFTQMSRFYAFTPTEAAMPVAAGDLGEVEILGRFDNTEGTDQHSPAFVSRRYGQGWVMMICSSADIEWSDWPKDRTYLSFVNDMLDYISRPGGMDFTASVGQPITHGLERGRLGARVSLQTPAFPEEDVVTLEPRPTGAGRAVSYENTRHAGIYQLTMSLADDTRTMLFARNVDPSEGRLEVADEQALRGFMQADFTYTNRLALAAAAPATLAQRSEYWKAALAALLMVLAAEVFLGQRFGHYT